MSEWFEYEFDMPDLTLEQWDRFDEFFKSIPNRTGKHWLIKHQNNSAPMTASEESDHCPKSPG